MDLMSVIPVTIGTGEEDGPPGALEVVVVISFGGQPEKVSDEVTAAGDRGGEGYEKEEERWKKKSGHFGKQ